jgi:hypothetical protein
MKDRRMPNVDNGKENTESGETLDVGFLTIGVTRREKGLFKTRRRP